MQANCRAKVSNEMFTGKHDAELTDLHAETCGLKQSAGGALSKRLYRR